MAREVAPYSRLRPSDPISEGGTATGPLSGTSSAFCSKTGRCGARGCSCRASHWQAHGCSSEPVALRSGGAAQSGQPSAAGIAMGGPGASPPRIMQHGFSQARQSSVGMTWTARAVHAATTHTYCFPRGLTAEAPHPAFIILRTSGCRNPARCSADRGDRWPPLEVVVGSPQNPGHSPGSPPWTVPGPRWWAGPWMAFSADRQEPRTTASQKIAESVTEL